MSEKIKLLVADRRQNKLKLQDLESQTKDLNDRLFQADRKSSITVTLGNKKIQELRNDIYELQQAVQKHKVKERKLKKRI